MAYDFKEVEKKWVDKYDGFDGFHGKDFEDKEKKYVLVEFPYPSGEGLHVGHVFSMTGTDVYARYLRMQGKNVMFPMGYDAFGLPAENYAIKTGINPMVTTKKVTERIRKQMEKLGFSFDWEREVNTTDPDYYKWTQWIFTKLFEKGLAVKEEKAINWCPKCLIGLANEEVVNGNCERCGTETERRTISQWVVKITAYAERLLSGLEKTHFIDKVKAAQVNWIDKKVGAKIRFQMSNLNRFPIRLASLKLWRSGSGMTETGIAASSTPHNDDFIEVFTTRPDTLAGVTFMVIAPEHPLVGKILKNDLNRFPIGSGMTEIENYIAETKKKSEMERTELNKDKTGVFSGLYAINPVSGKEIPIWIADYVLASYGTGAIMAVPSHDERDEAFALKYSLEIDREFVPDEKMMQTILEKRVGEEAVNYHLRDWIFSRQHYWGEPIPMVYCENCAKAEIASVRNTETRNDEGDGSRIPDVSVGTSKSGMTEGWIPVPEKDLPVRLPEVEKYLPTETGESPLANITDWVKVSCPKCGGEAKRETDTMPNWAGSDWYFLRYCDPKNEKVLADKEKIKYWLPVDVYVGGDEHNTLHLLYSRFIYQFLWDLGVVPKEVPEPYNMRLSHGVILGADGNRMSKSVGNVIVPDAVTDAYGADVLRTYMMFMGPFDATMAWNERSLVGVRRFIERFYNLVDSNKGKYTATSVGAMSVIHRLVKGVGDDIAQFKFNTAIAKMMEAVNDLTKIKAEIANEELSMMVRALAPFAPFVAEELWGSLGGEFSVHVALWPKYDDKYLLSGKTTLAIQINGKLRSTLEVESETGEEEAVFAAKNQEKVQKYLSEGTISRVIFVKGKAINFVVI